MAVSGSRDEDQPLGSTVDGRQHRVPDPNHSRRSSYSPIEPAGWRPSGHLHLDRWIDLPAIRCGRCCSRVADTLDILSEHVGHSMEEATPPAGRVVATLGTGASHGAVDLARIVGGTPLG